MGAPKLGLALVATLSAASVAGMAGCRGSTPQPVTRAEKPPETAAAPTATPPPASPSQTPAAGKKDDPNRDDAPVIVDPGIDDSAPKTLAEAAAAERERRAKSDKAKIVINDKTLPRYAAQGQITVADPHEKEKKEKKGAGAQPAPGSPEQLVRDEPYWRGHALEIRTRWRDAADRLKKLEGRSTELRQLFYSQNDSFVRDNQIKPEWDRVLDQLRQTRTEVDTAKKELADFLEEGRRADALPGWLREGEDQEPEEADPAKKKELPTAQAIEPPVINQDVSPPPVPQPRSPR